MKIKGRPPPSILFIDCCILLGFYGFFKTKMLSAAVSFKADLHVPIIYLIMTVQEELKSGSIGVLR